MRSTSHHIHIPDMEEVLWCARMHRKPPIEINGKRLPHIAGAAPLAVDAVFYTKGLGHINDADLDWADGAAVWKCMLATTTYAPNIEKDEFRNALGAGTPPANEVSGTGYTAGGVALGGRTIDTATARTTALKTTTNPQWTASTFDFRYAIVYKQVGADATTPNDDILLFIVDCNHIAAANLSVSGGTLTITWDASGAAKYNENAYQT